MKVLQVNIFGNLSTGRIAAGIYRTLVENGHEGVVAFARNTVDSDIPHIRIGNKINVYADGVLTRLTDRAGFFSKNATKSFVEEIEKYDPDVIHLHNLHGYYINVEALFNYLRESNKPVVWTLHDCWSFTGHCCNFESIGCEKWKTGCGHCPNIKAYPASYRDNSHNNYIKKKELFEAVDNLTLVTPSQWLAGLVSQSYLKDKNCQVIYNGVDLNSFKPLRSDWLKKNGLEGKRVVLGVAGTWTPTKGLDDMVRLADCLEDNYQVVVVGVSKKQKDSLPSSAIGIERTYNTNELVEIYSAADFFVNPTYDDNFPNVNIEALACGTPVITYRTGGSPEAINPSCGAVVDKGDIVAVKDIITSAVYQSEMCVEQAKSFEQLSAYNKYIRLYEAISI